MHQPCMFSPSLTSLARLRGTWPQPSGTREGQGQTQARSENREQRHEEKQNSRTSRGENTAETVKPHQGESCQPETCLPRPRCPRLQSEDRQTADPHPQPSARLGSWEGAPSVSPGCSLWLSPGPGFPCKKGPSLSGSSPLFSQVLRALGGRHREHLHGAHPPVLGRGGQTDHQRR